MKQKKIKKKLAKKYDKDVRVINEITRHPFKFLYDVIESKYDNTPVRIMYLGAFTQKKTKNKNKYYSILNSKSILNNVFCKK